LNSLGVTGAPMDFNNLTMKTMVRYMKSHEGIRRVSAGLKAAGQPTADLIQFPVQLLSRIEASDATRLDAIRRSA
jgi:hypothetical protein